MKGCRALSDEELGKIREYFDNRIGNPEIDKWDLERRNKTIFYLNANTGFRISELLSLNIGNVMNEKGTIIREIYLKKSNTKGKVSGRSGFLNDNILKMVEEYIDHYYTKKGLEPRRDLPLFISRKGVRLCSRQCLVFYRAMFKELEFDMAITGSHTARKTYARKVYHAVGKNILDLKHAMGHSSLNSTAQYIQFDNENVHNALANLDIC